MAFTSRHIFAPNAIETSGMWNDEAIETIQEIGKQISKTTNDQNETMYLFQHVSVAIERG